MSWSFNGIGKPEKIQAAIDKAVETYRDQSRKEFEEAAPHLKALVGLMVGADLAAKVSASGHASFDASGAKTHGDISVSIEQLYGLPE